MSSVKESFCLRVTCSAHHFFRMARFSGVKGCGWEPENWAADIVTLDIAMNEEFLKWAELTLYRKKDSFQRPL